jgi:hypothetical protein
LRREKKRERQRINTEVTEDAEKRKIRAENPRAQSRVTVLRRRKGFRGVEEKAPPQKARVGHPKTNTGR